MDTTGSPNIVTTLFSKIDECDLFVADVTLCFTGDVDVIITDGFTGNVLLKTIEGFGKLVKRNLTESLKKNIFFLLHYFLILH